MLMTQSITDILNETPLFAGCPQETLSSIAAIAVERTAKRGEEIYESGSEAIDMYILVRGIVKFTTDHGVGTLNVETLMKRHMVFGWAALIPEHPRRLGNAICLEDSKLLLINGDALLDVLGTHPQSGFVVMRRLCSMIANTFIEQPPR